MKRFNNFGEYMFDLLFAPLKKGKKAINQFYIFFKVIGREFDDVKTAFFRIRDEANVVSSSPVMLPVFGQDRDMPRLSGEDVESYRTRLSMKALIAKYAGTRQGLLFALAAIGFGTCEIIPLVYQQPERWAEFLVLIKYDLNDTAPINISLIKKVVREVKPGSAKDNYLLDFSAVKEIEIQYTAQICFYMEFYPQFNLPQLHLDNTWLLDGSQELSGYNGQGQVDLYPVYIQIYATVTNTPKAEIKIDFFSDVKECLRNRQMIDMKAQVACHIQPEEHISIQTLAENKVLAGDVIVDNMNLLDESWVLDERRRLNGGIDIL